MKSLYGLFLIGWMGAAAAAPLSFARALEIAQRDSPDIAEQAVSLEAARSAAIAAGRLPDPALTAGVENFPVSGPDQGSWTRDFMTMRKVGLMQEFPNRAKREAQVALAASAIDRAAADQKLAILNVRRATATAWLERYFVERRLALLDQLEQENHLFAQAVQAQFSAGRGASADILMPGQEAAELADRRDELTAERAKAIAALTRWTGTDGPGPLAGDPPKMPLDVEYLRTHVHEHPDLAVYGPMADMARAELREAQAESRPDWSAALSYGRRGVSFGDMVTLEFTLGLPLFYAHRQDPTIEAKRHDLTRVHMQLDAMQRDHTRELEVDLADYGLLQQQLARIRASYLPIAEQKVNLTMAAYRAGTGDLTAVLAARRERVDQRMREFEKEGALAAAAARLYFYYGAGAGPERVSPEDAP